jgi:hypothetical protein
MQRRMMIMMRTTPTQKRLHKQVLLLPRLLYALPGGACA